MTDLATVQRPGDPLAQPDCHVCKSPCAGGVVYRWFGNERKPVCADDHACFKQWAANRD